MADRETRPPVDEEPQIAADDAGATAMAERLQKAAEGGETPDPAGDDSSTSELLIDGQEEVFSRAEVESGRIEHHAGEDGGLPDRR